MRTINLTIADDCENDWVTLYVDGKRVSEGHIITDNVVSEVLTHLGYNVTVEWKKITQACSELYDGEYLPDNISDLEFE